MPDIQTPQPKSRTPPKVLIVVSVAVLLLGVGKCGFFAPAIAGNNQDYGIGGALLIILGLILLTTGLVWLQRGRTEPLGPSRKDDSTDV